MSLLTGAADVGRDLQDLEHAIVQQARDRGIKVAEIAQTRNISEDKVRRDWPAGSIDRRMQQRKQRGGAPVPEFLNEFPELYLPEEEPGEWAGDYDSTEGPPEHPTHPHSCSPAVLTDVRATGPRPEPSRGRRTAACLDERFGTSDAASRGTWPRRSWPRPRRGRCVVRAEGSDGCRLAGLLLVLRKGAFQPGLRSA
ncbi:hypothetical protein [Streptomyces sp. NPDC029704]